MRYLLFLVIAGVVFWGCKGDGAQPMLDEAKKLLTDGKVEEAITQYKKVIQEFGSDTASVTAYYELARMYQSHLSERMSLEESKKEAVTLFLTISEKFPERKEAPTSLFMAAFIQANDMQKFDEATKNYKLFLEKYKGHELTASAQDELNNMGKPADAVLQEKTAPKVAGK